VQKEPGGNLGDILERTATVIRERLRIEGEVRIYTAQGRLTGVILSLLPLIMFFLINLANPGYSRILLDDPLGRKMIYTGAAAMLVGGMLGVVLDLVAVAPLTTRGGDFLTPLISTIAAGIVFENVALGAFGPDAYGFPLGTFPSGSITIGDAVVQPIDLFIVGLTVALMVGLTVFLRASKLGKAIRAVAANRLAAQLVGIDVAWTIAVTFFLASALGALAGIFYGLEFGSAIQFDMGGSIQLRGLAVIVVGGMGSIPGVMLGSLLLAASETVGVTEVGSPYRDAFAFALLFLVLLVRPSGLLGRRGLRTG